MWWCLLKYIGPNGVFLALQLVLKAEFVSAASSWGCPVCGHSLCTSCCTHPSSLCMKFKKKNQPLIRQYLQNCNAARYIIIKARDPENNYTDWNNRLVGRSGWRQFFRTGNMCFLQVEKTLFLATSPNVFELCIFEFPPGFTAQYQALNSWLCHMPSRIVSELHVWSPWDKVLPLGSLQSRCEQCLVSQAQAPILLWQRTYK